MIRDRRGLQHRQWSQGDWLKLRSVGSLSVLSLVFITSCLNGDRGTQPEPSLGPILRVASAEEIVLPFDGYGFTDREDKTIGAAHNKLIRDCGKRFGVAVTLPPPNNPSIATLNARRYGIIDREEAERMGYSWAGDDDAESEKSGAGGWDPSQAERQVVLGQGTSTLRDSNGRPVPEGGCVGEAERELGLPSGGLAQQDELGNDSLHLAEQDSRVLVAMSSWSKCMKRAGFSYDSIWDPNDQQWPEPPSQTEIATASADARCKGETNLAGIWLAVESAYQRRAISEHAEAFESLKTWRDERVRRATLILQSA